MRGEHFWLSRNGHGAGGSSPHAWGTPEGQTIAPCNGRFIPTCVGNTHGRGLTHAALPVHPHMRGEHAFASRRRVSTSGSSPHAWGTRRVPRQRETPLRFIPTCVGNTS